MSWLEKRWYSNKPAPLLLRPLARLFHLVAERKKKRDQQNPWISPVPLVIVGNITVGGTGKTPFTCYLVKLLKAQGFKPGIISRGYKSTAQNYPFDVSQANSADEAGDEPFMLQRLCACPVIIDPDRPAAAEYLLSRYDCDVIISDDGLQHYRLGRDIEVAVIDGERGLGNGALLPAGPLRETESRLHAVDFIIANGCMCSSLAIDQYVMKLEPARFVSLAGNRSVDCAAWQQGDVHAVAGIGNPQRFFNTLKFDIGLNVIAHPKPDHHRFTARDFAFADSLPVIMTEKDAVKLLNTGLSDAWYLEVNAVLPSAFESAFLQRLQQVISEKVKING